MQFKAFSALTALALATFAPPTPFIDAKSSAIAGLLALLDIAVQDVTAQVGVTCSPITVVGVSGTACSEQPVCCTNNSFNGVVALGCTPINLNL